MKLKVYLAEKAISITGFAKACGTGTMAMSRYVKGEDQPGLELALVIARESEGEVLPQDLLCDHKRKYSKTGDSIYPASTGNPLSGLE